MSVGLETGLEAKLNDATPDDMTAMVKEFMEERRELTAGSVDPSKKPTAGDDDTSAGDDNAAAGQKRAGSEDSAKKGGKKEDSASEWLTDELRAELPRWLSDEDLSEFASRDELDRALSLMDRAALKAGRETGTQDDAGQAKGEDQRGKERGQDGKFVKNETRDAGDNKPFEIALDLSEFDEDLSKLINSALTGLRDHYESRVSALEARDQQRERAAIETQFDSIVDALGHADLFGESGKESEKQLEARRKLFDEHHVYLTGLKALGREGRMDKASVARVLRMAFADHISKQEQKKLTQRITKQSSLRMGIGVERPVNGKFEGPLHRHPDIQRAYKQLQEAQGEL